MNGVFHFAPMSVLPHSALYATEKWSFSANGNDDRRAIMLTSASAKITHFPPSYDNVLFFEFFFSTRPKYTYEQAHFSDATGLLARLLI